MSDELLKKYEEHTATMTKLEKAIEVVKGQRSANLKTLLEKSGKGPYTVGGESLFIFSMGETYFMSKPRGKAKK